MKHIFLMISVAALVGCAAHHPHYDSVDEYPMKQGSCAEVSYAPDHTDFAVWAPNADSVILRLYASATDSVPVARIPMDYRKDGSYTAHCEGDLAGQFYTFCAYDPRNEYGVEETPGIFAKAVGINGHRGAIIDMAATNPEGWSSDVRPALGDMSDIIVYEMHHRDFSIDSTSGITHRGKFLALTEHGTTSPEGEKTGIDHLLELGVTHIQILPSYDFGSIDESGASSEARVLASGAAAGGRYNWGYDPVNYNVPEGSYSTNPADPACRIRGFKQMIQACHQAGIRVILDVVYNHTYDVAHSGFTQTAPHYFYRENPDGELGNASGCGNETASERAMMRRFMLESVRYWAEEYHIDGFRFDLMGIHDIETMNAIRQMLDSIDPTIVTYGEGWAAGTPLLDEKQTAFKAHVPSMHGVGAFCDDMRDALRGPFSDDHQGAFLAGIPGSEESIRFGIAGCIDHPELDMTRVNYSRKSWCEQPTQMVSYVSCHDDMMLTDRLMASIASLSPASLKQLDCLAQTAVLTSQGMPFIRCGEEVLRNKKGVHNSFCSPDSINAIDWHLKSQNRDVFDYYRQLIALRRAHPALHLGRADLVRNHLHFLPTPDCVVAYTINGAAVGDSWNEIVVVLNASSEPWTPTGEGYTLALGALAPKSAAILYR